MKRIFFITFVVVLLVFCLGVYFFRKSAVRFDTVVFITIDTLRKDHVKSYGYPFETSPFIDKLNNEGVVFNNAFTASSHTAPSHTTMFTGLYPQRHKVLRNHDSLSKDIYNIKKHFENHGFKTIGFPATRFLDGKVSFDKLGEKYYDRIKKIGSAGWFLLVNQNIERVKAWFEDTTPNKNDKLFLWLHLYDVHQWAKTGKLPEKYFEFVDSLKKDPKYYDYLTKEQHIPESFFESKEDMLTKISTYDAKLRWVNEELISFLDFLKDERKDSKILIVLLADHGEGLGNHNYAEHGKYLYEEQLRIPLIFWSNTKEFLSKKRDSLISSVDLFSTISDLVGIPLSEEQLKNQDGISFKNIILGDTDSELREYIFAERRPKDTAMIRQDWIDGKVKAIADKKSKYIYNEKAENEFYNLTIDPFELDNIAKNEEKLVKKYDKKLHYILTDDFSDKIEDQNLTKKEIKELKALGYL